MSKIKYIFRRLKTLDIKNMYKISKKISNKTNKNIFYILFDIIRCAIKYGSGYMDYFEFEFYLLNDKERQTYITSSINNQIIKKYNDPNKHEVFDDKVIFNNIYKEYLNRDYIDLRVTNYKDFKDFIKKHKKIIVKPISECGGVGIEVINVSTKTKKEELYNYLNDNKKYLVEEFINQSESMNELYSGSVNTLRIISFVTNKKEVVILKSILKIGNNSNVDNFSSGGMYTFVDENGVVYVPAIDKEGCVYESHPQTNTKIVGFKIKNYNKIKEFVKELALITPEVRYVGWDIAISEKGPVLIEGNDFSGIFQVKPSISNIKTGDLPNYKKYMKL